MVSLPTVQTPPSPNPTAKDLSLKRKHSSYNMEDETLLSNQVKRQRVTFDPDVEIRMLHSWQDKGQELVRAEVRRAIDDHAAGDDSVYDQIKTLFRTRPTEQEAPSSSPLQRDVIALTGRVGALNKTYAGLVRAVIETQWLWRDDGFVESYTRFLGVLASSHGGYLSLILSMLVENLGASPSAAFRPLNISTPPRSQLYLRVHQIIKYLLGLVPAASATLQPILPSSYPFEEDDAKTHVAFVKNLLTMASYVPELKGEILSLITERLVKIDVQIQADLEDLDDEDDEGILTDSLQKQLDGDESDESDTDSISDDDEEDSEERKVKALRATIVKMDAVLDILFDYYHPIFAKGSLSEIDDAFQQLLWQYANLILPTYRSRHTQFLLFHFAQTSPHLIERFAGACAHVTFDKTRPHLLRLAAAAYLASFISRGAHVSSKVVREVFGILGDHLDSLRIRYETSCTGPDLRRFGSFYAISQALLYIFCFRWRDLLQDSETFTAEDADEILLNNNGMELRWTSGARDMISRNVYSKLNPLKICSPVIVTQFAKIAHHLRFLYVFPLLEKNKRVRLTYTHGQAGYTGVAASGLPERETALSAKGGDSAWQLDAYFPFDPYRLPRSKRWLEGDYVEWKGVPGLDEVDEKEDEGESEDEEGPAEDEMEYDSEDSEQVVKSVEVPYDVSTRRISSISP